MGGPPVVAAVVDLAVNEPPAQRSRDMIYCRIPLNDGDGNPNTIIETAVRCGSQLTTIRPVIAFAPSEPGWIKGSARSVPGVHVRDALDAIAKGVFDISAVVPV